MVIINKIGFHIMASSVSKKNHFQTQLAALLFIDIILLIPFMVVRAVAIFLLGVLIYKHERQLKMLVPASPGFVFWCSNFASYIIGGVGLTILSSGKENFCLSVTCEEYIGLSYLNDGLFYLGIGLSFYLVGMWLAGLVNKPNTPSNIFMDLNFSPATIMSISVIFFISTIAGGNEEIDTDYGHSIYYNLVVGSVASISYLPIILLSIYLLHKNKKWWLISMLFCSRFITSISGMILGYGRSLLIEAILALVLTWLALLFWRHIKITTKAKWRLISLPFLLLLYFGIASIYRDTANDRSLTNIERQEALTQSASSAGSSEFIINTLTQFCARAFQGHGMELFGMAETGIVGLSGWTENDLEQAIYIYIPKTWYPNKGSGLGRNIMVEYGFTEFNNIPVTLIADSYRRSGLFGVIIVYFCMGFVATAMTVFLNNHWGSVGPLLALYLANSSLGLISADVIPLYSFYVYRMVTSGFLIYVLLRVTGFLPKGISKNTYKFSSSNKVS